MITSLSAVLPEDGVVVFDLDDTLYPEMEFVRSGFRAVARYIGELCTIDVLGTLNELFDAGQQHVFDRLILGHRLPLLKSQLIEIYREHQPELSLAREASQLLSSLRAAGHSIGLMTDGRSTTQRNKIRALGLEALVDAILISEEFGSAKPAQRNYKCFERRFPRRRYAYVGNDPAKDFVTANRLGWKSICVLDPGDHIHPQLFDRVSVEAHPQYVMERLA